MRPTRLVNGALNAAAIVVVITLLSFELVASYVTRTVIALNIVDAICIGVLSLGLSRHTGSRAFGTAMVLAAAVVAGIRFAINLKILPDGPEFARLGFSEIDYLMPGVGILASVTICCIMVRRLTSGRET